MAIQAESEMGCIESKEDGAGEDLASEGCNKAAICSTRTLGGMS